MKSIRNYFESKLNQDVDEGKCPSIEINQFAYLVNNDSGQDDDDSDAYNNIIYDLSMPDDVLDFIKTHCKILEGDDSNTCYDYLKKNGINPDDLGVDKNTDPQDVFPSGELGMDVLTVIGNAIGMRNVKCGGCWYTLEDNPTFVLFDVKNSMTKDILNKIEDAS